MRLPTFRNSNTTQGSSTSIIIEISISMCTAYHTRSLLPHYRLKPSPSFNCPPTPAIVNADRQCIALEAAYSALSLDEGKVEHAFARPNTVHAYPANTLPAVYERDIVRHTHVDHARAQNAAILESSFLPLTRLFQVACSSKQQNALSCFPFPLHFT